MQEPMGGEDLRKALIALGERLRARTDIVVGGAGALILTGELPRATSDFDVLIRTRISGGCKKTSAP